MATLRAQLKQTLTELQVPRGLKWKVSTSGAGPRELRAPMLMITQDVVKKAPQAPLGVLLATLTVTLLSHLKDPDKVDDALEADLQHLIDMLDDPAQLPGLSWTEARRATWATSDTISFPAYSLEVTIHYERD